MTSSKFWVVFSCLILVANVLFNHYQAPMGMVLSPLVAALMTRLVMFYGPVWPPYLQTGLCAVLLALQDIGIKLTGGGSHDAEGQGFMNSMVLLGALLSLGFIAKALWGQKLVVWWLRLAALVVFTLLIWLHLELFNDLGEGLKFEL
ncbi:hypothetical protein [Hymenobacter persicinus]|uniref:Uncharacterized protein n=1 Tax=Hymenobacter persicinus TaxID=2025506 RepID=A0A4Q5LE13_9BACT|nr:hypothetical protein [Hymenobacter persicinus]RYU81819.1 hypothetical protein EWM57_05415 [Hymenobacter persicinus]